MTPSTGFPRDGTCRGGNGPIARCCPTPAFEWAGREEFIVEHRWSLRELAGYVRSTSALPASVLRDQADAFDADLAARLGPFGHGGVFTQTVSFAYELGRKPLVA